MEKFEELSQEKQRRIIDAGMEEGKYGGYSRQGWYFKGIAVLLF